MNEKEGLLPQAWSVWQQREDFVAGDLEFEKALRSGSQLLPMAEHRSPGYLAATILLAIYAMYKNEVEHLKILLHSIKVLVEAQGDIDSDDEVSQRLLPMSSLFIIYGAMARQEDIRESMPIWDKCFRGTAHGARLEKLAQLSAQIGVATADELSRLAQSTFAEIKHMCDAYMTAPPHEKPLAAEYLVVYLCFELEIFKRSNQTGSLESARNVHLLSQRLRELGLGGYCVASFPLWHVQTFARAWARRVSCG